ncbi:hypothetical protein Tco_0609116 [Tanacetum coccineum]
MHQIFCSDIVFELFAIFRVCTPEYVNYCLRRHHMLNIVRSIRILRPSFHRQKDPWNLKCLIKDQAWPKLQIVEWHNYKHLDWITIRRDDDKLYTFQEGDFNRLPIQDIKDMLLLLVQGKLTNLTIEECLDFNVSLRMFTRSIVIQRRVEDLQLTV